MPYTARTLTAATERPTIRLGRSDASLRASGRLWRVRLWWVRRFRTWRPKPLSVEQMLRLQATRDDLLAYWVTLYVVLREVLPRRWWYRFTGDPVRMVFALPDDVRRLVLKAVVTQPGTDRDVSGEGDADDIAALAALQRRARFGDQQADAGVSLAVAALSVRAAYGETWYWNPARWDTSDGYAPFALCLAEYAGVQTLEVRRRLEVADGYSLAHAKPHERAKVSRMAYPAEVC